MAVNLVTVTGNIETLTGTTPSLARIWFKLSRPDWNLDGDIFAPEYTEAVASGGGAFSVALQSTDDLEAGASYSAILRYRDAVDGQDREYVLSNFLLPTGGPFQLGDLLAVPFVEPVPADILALATAAAVATNADRIAAAASAADAEANAIAAAASADAAAAFDGNGLWANDVASLLANTGFTYTAGQPGTVVAGQYIRTRKEGFAYQVAASGATNQHVTTAGGVKLYVMPGESGFNVKAFGALGNGTTDDTTAIRTAIRAAVGVTGLTTQRDPTGAVYFPVGVYRITQSGLFSDYGVIKRNGVLCAGDGPGNTIIWLNPTTPATDFYFYDNGAVNRAWHATFRDMSFRGGKVSWRHEGQTVAANYEPRIFGFRFQGPNWESAHVFENCEFSWLRRIASYVGDNNADAVRWSDCDYSFFETVDYIDNPQSLSITHTGDYVVQGAWGHVVQYGPNCNGGGGNYTWQGGALILIPDAASGATVCSVVNVVDGGPSSHNLPIVFENLRIEVRGEISKICDVTYGSASVIFKSCTFWFTGTVPRNMVTVGGFCDVFFDHGAIVQANAAVTPNMTATAGTRFGKSPSIRFRDYHLPYWDDATITVTGFARIDLDDCYQAQAIYAVEPRTREINGTLCQFSAMGQTNSSTKTRTVRPCRFMPGPSGANETKVSLPRNATITAIRLLVPAGSTGSGFASRIRIGNENKTVVYAETATLAESAARTLNAQVLVRMGSSLVDRTVSIWADDGSGGTNAGVGCTPQLFEIEYT